MTQSILTSTKKMCGIAEDQTEYDLDIIMHINTAFNTLNQLGIGPEDGFMIEDKDATWAQFLGGDINLNAVKTLIFLKVQLVFDPPVSGVAIDAKERQIRELEWRLNVHREDLLYPTLLPDFEEQLDDPDFVVEGGTP